MLIEERIYTLRPVATGEYLRLYEAEGLAIQKRILGRMVGYFVSEIGPLNQLIHMWAYDSFEDRMRRRAALLADPGWQGYIAKIKDLLLHQESKLLVPTSFSPIGGNAAARDGG